MQATNFSEAECTADADLKDKLATVDTPQQVSQINSIKSTSQFAMPPRNVIVAVDGSKHSIRAFSCKY